jgi:hypothetical protein
MSRRCGGREAHGGDHTMTENHSRITPADALRAFVRARYKTRPELADEIGPVYPWFHLREKIYLQGFPENADDPEWVAARQLLAELKDKICAGDIRAYGSLDHAKPDAIDPNELAIGELDFDEKTLDCDGGRRIYREVHLLRCDVDHLIGPAAGKSEAGRKGGRKPYDRQAIEKRVGELMDHHGNFSTDDPDWNTDARLVEKLEDELGISRSTLYETIPPMVDAWRRSKSGN